MSKRGRKPPIHTPLLCTSCGESPRVRDNVIQPHVCVGGSWNLNLIRDRLPKWAEQLREQV